MGVFGSVEVTIRVMFAMVLSDVLDLEWPAKLAQRLRETEDNRGLERMAFGTRVDMLRLALELHAGAPQRVLPDLRPWWSAAEAPLLELVQARNQVTHLAALEEADPADARRRFSLFLSSARWLQQVQLIHVDKVSRERGRFATHLYRLRGVAPWTELSLELDTSFSAPLEGNAVYLGNAAGTAWALSPFFAPRRRSVAVFDGLDKRGQPLFFDPTLPAADALSAGDGFPLPGEDWQRVPWGDFLDARKRSASTWRVSEPRPDALLRLPVTADATLSPGTHLDYLELVAPLGEGGFATVWEAKDLHTGERVAVKVLRPEVAGSERELVRFEEEVALLRRLKAQGCRRLIGPVEAFRAELGGERRLVLKMPILAGTVTQAAEALRLEGGAPSPEQVARWGSEALEGLVELHAHGVVHRDVKPSNLLLDADGQVVLADLGIARDLERDARVTRTGEALGSDLYMAPEQRHSPLAVSGKADVYGLACALHELLTGDDPVLPGKHVAEPLGGILRRMAAVDPEERPDAAQAAALLAPLAGDARPSPARGPSRRAWLAGGALLTAVLVIAGAALGPAVPVARPAVCGDGEVTAPEECDDGNTTDGDLCTARCTWNVVTLPAGSYVMGFTEADLDAGMHLVTKSRRPPSYMEEIARQSTPATPVRVREFGIMRTEVSNAAFDGFLADTGYGRLEDSDRTSVSKRWHRELIDAVRRRHHEGAAGIRQTIDGSLRPEVPTGVQMESAAAFCAWAGGTVAPEALWEYAARGAGDGRIYPWGDSPLTGAPEDCQRITGFFISSEKPVRSFVCGGRQPSPLGTTREGCTEYGVCDLSGNQDEFVHPVPASWRLEVEDGLEHPVSSHPGPTPPGDGGLAPDWAWFAADDPFGLRTRQLLDVDAEGRASVNVLSHEQALFVVRGGNYLDSLPVLYQSRAHFASLERWQLKGIRCVFSSPPYGRFTTTPAKPAPCGDGVVTPPEACDDGNTDDGDLCTSRCRSNLARVLGGTFEMGYSAADLDAGLQLLGSEGRPPDELQRRVQRAMPSTALQIFSAQVMRTKVSQASFDRFLASDSPGRLGWARNHAVVSWMTGLMRTVRERERRRPRPPGIDPRAPALVDPEGAAAYCMWLGAQPLPEATWEYIARNGGQDVVYPWGNSPTPERGGCTEQGVCELVSGEPELVDPQPVTWVREETDGGAHLVSRLLGDEALRYHDSGQFQGTWQYWAWGDPFGLLEGWVLDLGGADIVSRETLKKTARPRSEVLLVVRGGAGANNRDRWPYVGLDERHAFRCLLSHE